MGKVFTYQQVQHRCIPILVNFDEVAADVQVSFNQNPSILGGILCGSVMRRDHTVRSDIDCFVVYDILREKEALLILQDLSKRAAARYVPLCFLPFDSRLAVTGLAHVGSAFRAHLEAAIAQGGVIKKNPLDDFVTIGTVKDDVFSYLRTKLYKLSENGAAFPGMSLVQQAAYLQKVLESPIHVARKVLQLKGMWPLDDSKRGVTAGYLESMPLPLVATFRFLVDLDREYTHELGRYIANPDLAGYRNLLARITREIPTAIRFVRENLLSLA